MGSSKLLLPLLGVAIGFIAVTLGPDFFAAFNESTFTIGEESANIDGMTFPKDIKIAGSKQSLIGGGTRSKWGFRVYTVGFFGDSKLIKTLTKKYTGDNIVVSTNDFTESKLARTMLLRFQREVASSEVSDSLGEALIDKVGKETSNTYSSFILDMIGGDKLEKGSDMFITCKGEKLWASLTEGKDASTISIKGLCSVILKMYLGDSPVSPQVKEGFEKNFADLLSSS